MAVLITLNWKKGKTWVAAITGTDRKFGLKRDWCSMQSKEEEKAAYVLDDGIYECQDGKEPYPRRIFEVRGDSATMLTMAQLLAKLGGKAPKEVKALTPEEEAEYQRLRERKRKRDELRKLIEAEGDAEYNASHNELDYEIEARLNALTGNVSFTNEGGIKNGN